MKGKQAVAAARRREREAQERLEIVEAELAEERKARRDADAEVARLRAIQPELERLRVEEHERQTHRESRLRRDLTKATDDLEIAQMVIDAQGKTIEAIWRHMGYDSVYEIPLELVNEWHTQAWSTKQSIVLSIHTRALSEPVREAYERSMGYRDREKATGTHRTHVNPRASE